MSLQKNKSLEKRGSDSLPKEDDILKRIFSFFLDLNDYNSLHNRISIGKDSWRVSLSKLGTNVSEGRDRSDLELFCFSKNTILHVFRFFFFKYQWTFSPYYHNGIKGIHRMKYELVH